MLANDQRVRARNKTGKQRPKTRWLAGWGSQADWDGTVSAHASGASKPFERAVAQTSTELRCRCFAYDLATTAPRNITSLEHAPRCPRRRTAPSIFFSGGIVRRLVRRCPAVRFPAPDGNKQRSQHSGPAMLLWEHRLRLSGSQRPPPRGAGAQCEQGRPAGPGMSVHSLPPRTVTSMPLLLLVSLHASPHHARLGGAAADLCPAGPLNPP
jgi:hypothetical protein